jgi:hypothetical protein
MKTHTSHVKGNRGIRKESHATPSVTASQAKPTPHNNFAAIPAELKKLPRWVNWQFVERDGKSTKVPVDPNIGQLASSSEPDTWGTYADALARFNNDSVDGIGFQLGDSYVGIDLDRCRNPKTGEIESQATEIIGRLSSYAEISPSGTGVHILTKGTLPQHGRRKGPVEIYSDGRFFTMTGQHLDGTPTTVEERQSELTELHAQIFGTAQSSDATTGGAVPAALNSLADDEIIDRARNAKNGDKFSRLWTGDFSQYNSPSEADLALCMMLAFWTGRDADRIDSLFRLSKLFRPKWDERRSADGRTYGQLTIEKAIDGTREVWHQPVSPSTNSRGGGTGSSRPVIVYNDRQLDEVTREALDALRASNSPPELFVRSGQIVRVRADEESRPIIDIVGEPELRARLASVTDAMINGKSGPVNCFPHKDVVKNILALGEWPFPALQGIVEAPALRPDGTVLMEPGYDTMTRLLYVPAPGLCVPEISDEPDNLDVAAALNTVEETIGDFPFADEASKTNTLATMLTSIVRPAIRGKTPLALIDAPQMGTGKGLLSEVIGLIATGRDSAMMSAPREEEEWRKRITATLLTGASVIIIDNVERELDSAALASVLTAREWTDRILGLSKMVTLPVRTIWIANGNNIKVGGDIARRCYSVRLDAKTARPWKRTEFKHKDLLRWVSENRGEILAALLTLARAWFAAGKPNYRVPAVGGFDEWARTVGGVLGFAGVTGFLKNLDGLYDTADESSLQWEAFLELLASTFEDEPFTVNKLVGCPQTDPQVIETLPDDVTSDGDGEVNLQRRLGKAFSKREGRRYGDSNIHLERSGMKSRAVKWCVVRG